MLRRTVIPFKAVPDPGWVRSALPWRGSGVARWCHRAILPALFFTVLTTSAWSLSTSALKIAAEVCTQPQTGPLTALEYVEQNDWTKASDLERIEYYELQDQLILSRRSIGSFAVISRSTGLSISDLQALPYRELAELWMNERNWSSADPQSITSSLTPRGFHLTESSNSKSHLRLAFRHNERTGWTQICTFVSSDKSSERVVRQFLLPDLVQSTDRILQVEGTLQTETRKPFSATPKFKATFIDAESNSQTHGQQLHVVLELKISLSIPQPSDITE